MIMQITPARLLSWGSGMLGYLNASPTAFHAAQGVADRLRAEGFVALNEAEPWYLDRGGKYYVTRNQSGIIAFEIGHGEVAESGFRIIGAHTDSPSFRIKPGGCMATADGYVKLNTEPYGGAIVNSWFDRPLSLAGRVWFMDGGTLVERLIDLAKPLFIIPSLCVHFQRDLKEGGTLNKQIHVLPFAGMAREGTDAAKYLLPELAKEIKTGDGHIDIQQIVDYDLYLYEYEKGTLMGAEDALVSASRLDDLSMVYCGLQGLLRSAEGAGVKVLAAFDNEEVGSVTYAGANSSYLAHTLKRVCDCLHAGAEGYYRAAARSYAVSADSAHAVHPNYADKHDPVLHPVLGGGPTIKYSASQRYATNAQTAARFIQLCKAAQVPYQQFAIRSDMTGGSTIGPAMSAALSIPVVDVGTPILAMHSIRELGSVADHVYTAEVFKHFFEE